MSVGSLPKYLDLAKRRKTYTKILLIIGNMMSGDVKAEIQMPFAQGAVIIEDRPRGSYVLDLRSESLNLAKAFIRP